jgi:prolyl oligopeptidase
VIHGTTVLDPHRWLEDRSLPETEEWIRTQQRHCQDYFAQCRDISSIRRRVASYLDVVTIDQPAKVGDQYFYRKRRRGQDQGALYVRRGLDGPERLLVDPAVEGRFVSVGIHRISGDGSLLSYEVKHGGEDESEIRIVDVEQATTLKAQIEHGVQRGFVFAPDNEGFFYSRFSPKDPERPSIRLHRFGSTVEDAIIFRVDPSPAARLLLLSDGVQLGALHVYVQGSELVADFWVADFEDPLLWHPVALEQSLPYAAWLQDGGLYSLIKGAGVSGKIVEIDRNGQEMRTVVPDCGIPIHQLAKAGRYFCMSYLSHSQFRVCCRGIDTDECCELELPINGTIHLLPQFGDGCAVFLSYESFTQPPIIFEYTPSTGILEVWSRPDRKGAGADVEIREIDYPSLDGTRIPLTVVGCSHWIKTGPHPLLMNSYGGFGASSTPQFSVLLSVFLDNGALFALPHVRGGGEFGKDWHEAGRRKNKQTTFNDFVAAAKWLIKENITTPKQLAIFGGSNSGLLVGAVMTQAPWLFRAVLCIAPLLDMVRYEQFDQAARWRNEYGSVGIAEDFQALFSYSPYHAIREDVDYPAVLFVTGDKDERCNPAHVRKTAERLVERTAQRNSVIVDYDEERGHVPVLPLQTRIDALTRRIAFIARELGLSISEGACDDSIRA